MQEMAHTSLKLQAEGTDTYFDEFKVADNLSPEQRMYLAVIERTLLDYVSVSRELKRERRDAERFLDHNGRETFSLFWFGCVLSNRPEEFIAKIRLYAKGERTKRANETK